LNRSEDTLKADILRTLRGVVVPGGEGALYDLNMIQDVHIEENRVRLVFTPHGLLCSSMQIAFGIRSAVKMVSGGRKVEIHIADYENACLINRD